MRNFILILFLSFTAVTFSFAEKKIAVDTNSPVNVRRAEPKILDKYINDKDFDYNTEIEKEPISLWDKLWISFWRQVARIFKYLFDINANIPQIRYIFLIIVVVLTAVFLLKTEIIKLFVGNGKKNEINFSQEEDIKKLDLDQIISSAIENKNYRRAVRYLYLKTLKELDKKEIVSWQKNKTNRDYTEEIKSEKLRKDFKELSFYYEYVWYGYFEISFSIFDKINAHYKKYLENI